ncbi:nadD [Symbiodinium sp. CCMP2592]|nr:nadD [Symbiodinium sp. CCMP2592]
MLRALRKKYPEGSKLLWVCGDDVFEWISNERGQAMLCELDGLIVQRRLHKAPDNQTDRFYQAPVDSDLVRALAAEHQVHVDFIYGELPHYSSTLVRNSPASWRAFLPQKVAAYLDERPALLAQLVRSGDAPPAQMTPPSSPLGEMAECEDLDDEMESVLDPLGLLSCDDENHRFHETAAPEKLEKPVAVGFVDLVPDEETSASTPSDAAETSELPHILGSILRSKRSPVSRSPNRKRTVSRPPSGQRLREAALSCVMRCLATVHSLQRERGQTALALALRGSPEGDVAARKLRNLRRATTETLQGDEAELLHAAGFAAGAAGAVAEELRHVPKWLSYDRALPGTQSMTSEECAPIGICPDVVLQ